MKKYIFIFIGIFAVVIFIKLFAQSKPVQLSELLVKAPGVVIDVRTNEEWNNGHRNEALHYDWNSGDFQRECIKFDKSKTYYLYCAAGARAEKAKDYMKSMGFKNVVNLGGYSNLK